MNSNTIILFHGPLCSDGWASAYFAKKVHPDALIMPVIHGNPPPPYINGKDVIIADFSYPKEVLLDMKKRANSLIVLDHHKTAEETLKDLDFCIFDMNRSGAGLVWDFLVKKERTWLVNYVEAVDLWKLDSLPYVREVNAYIRSYPMTIDAWNEIENTDFDKIVVEGKAIYRAQKQHIENLCRAAQEIVVAGYSVLAVNSPIFNSEIGHELARGRPFGVVYFINENGETIVSLRSDDNGIDTTEIAKKYKGGGHYHASGYKIEPGGSW